MVIYIGTDDSVSHGTTQIIDFRDLWKAGEEQNPSDLFREPSEPKAKGRRRQKMMDCRLCDQYKAPDFVIKPNSSGRKSFEME